MDQTDTAIVSRMLDVILDDIVPLTRAGVAEGNKIFGAALLRKDDLSTFLAGTNQETQNPLWHGEMQLLRHFYELPSSARPATSELLFLSTHEPCSLCLSAITWAGFDNFYYFFSHQDSRDSFAIPHDLKILHEVFGLAPGQYRKSNHYWNAFSIIDLVQSIIDPEQSALLDKTDSIKKQYALLSESYQKSKHDNDIPLD